MSGRIKMTDDELKEAPEVVQIERLLAKAGKLMVQLEKRSGRNLGIFCESGMPYLIDLDGDSESNGMRARAYPLDQGGSIVAGFISTPGRWDGGGW